MMTTEEAIEAVRPLFGTVIFPVMYHLRDGELMAGMTVDPDIAFPALMRNLIAREAEQ
jgi:hypothetical protein